MLEKTTYDYVIVGAGSAGCVLADRLSRDPHKRVLLLEAGGWDRDPLIKIPLGFGRIRQKRAHDWGYDSEPQESVGGRRIECRRGKVIGGSSSINAMVYVRGHRSDYDRWAASGLAGWSFDEVLPHFKRQENWAGGADAYRGGEGPVHTRASRYADPLTQAVIEAGVQAGHPRTDDYNGAQQHGLGLLQFTIRDGRRCSSADAFLRPALARPNLTVLTGALAGRVLIEQGRAVGIEYRHGGQHHQAQAGEVLLCGGVINSPQLLMLSGIGDAEELARHGLPVHAALPGVGRNYQDHVSVFLTYRRRSPGLLHRHMRADRVVFDLARAYLTGGGFAGELPSPLAGFLKTDASLEVPDIQVMLHGGPVSAHPYLPPFVPPYQDGFSLIVALLRPQARGRLRLASSDPATPLRIEQNFLGAEADWRSLIAGVRTTRELARQAALAPYIAAELAPASTALTDADLRAHIRATAQTVHHPLGTCKMGLPQDAHAVVDAQLRVHGIAGLRVVDASVMPDLVGGNINACVMMIAEKTATHLS